MSSEGESVVSEPKLVCDWLIDAKIYNHKLEKYPNVRLTDRLDVIVLYFSMRNADRFNIMHKFYEIYNNTKHVRLPFDVINIPMDDTKKDMFLSFDKQPKWFTLRHGDPLIPTLQYRYGITFVPHLLVMRPDGTIVSSHGILDLDEYGMNALLTWMSTAANRFGRNREISVELALSVELLSSTESKYHRQFSGLPNATDIEM